MPRMNVGVHGRGGEMRRERFDLSRYVNRTARIRIIDEATGGVGAYQGDTFLSSRTFVITLVTLSVLITGTMEAGSQGRIGPPENVRVAIEAKARELNWGSPAAGDQIGEHWWSIPGGLTGWNQYYRDGVIFYVTGRGVLVMTTAMSNAYRGDSFTRITHGLGFPITNEFRCLTPDPHDRYQMFEGGTIFWRATENQYVIEQGAPRPATPGDCARRPGPTATVVTAPQAAFGQKPPSHHRYRISILGFTANRQTADDPMQYDGKGDEVYVAVQVTKFQSNGEMVSNTGERSVLMGDTNQRPGNEERQTVGRLSADGGIGNGDTYLPGANRQGRYSKPTLPWVVYEGDLTTGFDALTVIPSIWEWDGNAFNFNWYREWSFGLRPGGRPAFFYDPEPGRGQPVRNTRETGRGWITQLVSESVHSTSGIAPASVWGEGPVISFRNRGNTVVMTTNDGDQPIGADLPQGATPQRVFVPKILFLTEQLAQRVVTMNFPAPPTASSSGNIGTTVEEFRRLGPGVIPIRYSGTDERTGDYTLFLKVEQLR